MNVKRLLGEGAESLREAGVESPGWDAERLLRHVVGWSRARLLASPESDVAPGAASRYRELVAERARRRPLQHIVGVQEFWRREFVVGPDVLIPRPETELLVEASLERLARLERPLVVDVGTGSGCLALSLAAEREDAEVHATELSAPALVVARENARRLGLEARVRFHHGDLLEPLGARAGELDLVVSNPPYVGADEVAGLEPEVRDHEPRLALVPPGDRFAVYRRLAPEFGRFLRGGGCCVLEVGAGMAAEVVGILETAGLRVDGARPDLAGVARAVVASRPAES